jgi:hypothetical protein
MDTGGAVRAVESITTGLQWRAVRPPASASLAAFSSHSGVFSSTHIRLAKGTGLGADAALVQVWPQAQAARPAHGV